jgi:hypothetical protein
VRLDPATRASRLIFKDSLLESVTSIGFDRSRSHSAIAPPFQKNDTCQEINTGGFLYSL